MTAYRVIDSHSELSDIGSMTHAAIDTHVSSSQFVVVGGVIPPEGRQLVESETIEIVDNGSGSTVQAKLATPEQLGVIFMATTTGSFTQALPIVHLNVGWLMNDHGYLIVSASYT